MLPLDIVNFINICGASVGVFLTLVIIGKKKADRSVKVILALLLSFLSLAIISTIGYSEENVSRAYILFGPCGPCLLVIGPLVYFYIKALIDRNFTIKKSYIFHFMPFIVNMLYSLSMSYIFRERFGEIAQNPDTIQYYISMGFVGLRLPHLTFYLISATVLLRNYRRSIVKSIPDAEQNKLGWLGFLIIAFSTLIVNNILCSFMHRLVSNFAEQYIYIYNSWMTILLIFLGYKGLVQPDIFSSNGTNGLNEKYKNSPLTKELSEKYLKKLLDCMKDERPFTDSALTLSSLAERLSIPARYLSQIINENLDQNFLDFVNRYRVEEAKKQLISEENKNYTILGIAFDVGFNSKSTFNTVFKKYTSMSPSQYLRSCKN